MLPQLVALGGMAAACWFGMKWIKQEVNRVDGDMKRAQRMLQRVKNSPMPQLRFNSVSGHYHPVD